MPNSYLGFQNISADISDETIRQIVERTKDEISKEGLVMDGGTFSNIQEPESDDQVANKSYVDANGGVGTGRTIVTKYLGESVLPGFYDEFVHMVHIESPVFPGVTFVTYLDITNVTKVFSFKGEYDPNQNPVADLTSNLPSSSYPLALCTKDETIALLYTRDSDYKLHIAVLDPQTLNWTLTPVVDPVNGPLSGTGSFLIFYNGWFYFRAGFFPNTSSLWAYEPVTGSLQSYTREMRDLLITIDHIYWVHTSKLYRSPYAFAPDGSIDFSTVSTNLWMDGGLTSVYYRPSSVFEPPSAGLQKRGIYIYITVGDADGAIYRALASDPDGYFEMYARGVTEVITFTFDENHVYTISDESEEMPWIVGRGYDGLAPYVVNPMIMDLQSSQFRIVDLPNPTDATEATRKSYVDDADSALDVRVTALEAGGGGGGLTNPLTTDLNANNQNINQASTIEVNHIVPRADLTSNYLIIGNDTRRTNVVGHSTTASPALEIVSSEGDIVIGPSLLNLNAGSFRYSTTQMFNASLHPNTAIPHALYVDTQDAALQADVDGLRTEIVSLQNSVITDPVNSDINMQDFNITQLGALVGDVQIQGGVEIQGVLNMGGSQIENVPAPTVNGDAVNKQYVDTEITTVINDLILGGKGRVLLTGGVSGVGVNGTTVFSLGHSESAAPLKLPYNFKIDAISFSLSGIPNGGECRIEVQRIFPSLMTQTLGAFSAPTGQYVAGAGLNIFFNIGDVIQFQTTTVGFSPAPADVTLMVWGIVI